MKKTIFTIAAISIVGFVLLGSDEVKTPAHKENNIIKVRKSKIRPTIEQEVQLGESKLKVQNSRIDEGFAS